MSVNIEETLFIRLSMSNMFALQLDESTDIASTSSTLVFVRSTWEKQLYEVFCFLASSCILRQKIQYKFFTKYGIRWEKCVRITIDDATATAYLADEFEILNVLNLSLQGIYIDVFQVKIKKFEVWAKRIENYSFCNFPTLQVILES